MNTYTFHIDLYAPFFLITISIGLTFALQLGFTKGTNRTANRFLNLALVAMVLWVTGYR